MKAAQTFPILVTALVALLLPSGAFAKSKKTDDPSTRLQLTINIVTPDPLEGQKAAEQLALIVNDIFHVKGYTGKIEHIYRQKLKQNEPVLDLQVSRWRIDQVGSPEIVFTASLNTRSALIQLGEFNVSDPAWNSGVTGRGGSEETRRVAERALRQLADKIREQGALEGFPPPKDKDARRAEPLRDR